MDDILALVGGVGALIGIICLFAFLIYVLRCASRKDALLEIYDGFFTGAGAYFYLCFSLMRFIVPLLFAGGAVAMYFFGEEMLDLTTVLIIAAAGLVIGLVLHLLRASRYRRLKEDYGPMAARELSRAMIQVGWGIAFGMACLIVKASAVMALHPHYVMTTDGRPVFVVRASETQYIDMDGNLYDICYVN